LTDQGRQVTLSKYRAISDNRDVGAAAQAVD
jgi:hypothetical protein